MERNLKLQRVLSLQLNALLNPMIRVYFRAALHSPVPRSAYALPRITFAYRRQFNSTQWRKEDPRMPGAGREIVDEFAVLREKYGICAEFFSQYM